MTTSSCYKFVYEVAWMFQTINLFMKICKVMIHGQPKRLSKLGNTHKFLGLLCDWKVYARSFFYTYKKDKDADLFIYF